MIKKLEIRKIKLFVFPLLVICSILAIGACGHNSKSRESYFSIRKDSSNFVAYLHDSALFLYEQNRDTNYFVTHIPSGFISETLESVSDSVVIIGYDGERTDSAFLKKTGEAMKCPCSHDDSAVLRGYVQFDDYVQLEYKQVTYKAINVFTKEVWIYKTVNMRFAKYEKSRLDVRTIFYNQMGDIKKVMDTIVYSNNSTMPSARFIFRPKSVDNKMIETAEDGSLLLIENETSTVLLKNKHPMQYNKCQNGFYDPDISPDGNWVVFRKMASNWEAFDCDLVPKDSGVFEMNIKTKELKELIHHNAMHPIYSPGGRYVLLSRNQKRCENDKIVVDVVILDLSINHFTTIGTGDCYVWMNHH